MISQFTTIGLSGYFQGGEQVQTNSVTLSGTPVPEPEALSFLAMAGTGMLLACKRKR